MQHIPNDVVGDYKLSSKLFKKCNDFRFDGKQMSNSDLTIFLCRTGNRVFFSQQLILFFMTSESKIKKGSFAENKFSTSVETIAILRTTNSGSGT